MKLNIRTFGITKDILGQSEMDFEIENNTSVGQLMDLLKLKYPSLNQISSILVAVNEEYAEPNVVLTDRDEVALIPPVSGG